MALRPTTALRDRHPLAPGLLLVVFAATLSCANLHAPAAASDTGGDCVDDVAPDPAAGCPAAVAAWIADPNASCDGPAPVPLVDLLYCHRHAYDRPLPPCCPSRKENPLLFGCVAGWFMPPGWSASLTPPSAAWWHTAPSGGEKCAKCSVNPVLIDPPAQIEVNVWAPPVVLQTCGVDASPIMLASGDPDSSRLPFGRRLRFVVSPMPAKAETAMPFTFVGAYRLEISDGGLLGWYRLVATVGGKALQARAEMWRPAGRDASDGWHLRIEAGAEPWVAPLPMEASSVAVGPSAIEVVMNFRADPDALLVPIRAVLDSRWVPVQGVGWKWPRLEGPFAPVDGSDGPSGTLTLYPCVGKDFPGPC